LEYNGLHAQAPNQVVPPALKGGYFESYNFLKLGEKPEINRKFL
jgi:hypothetical protein